MVKISVNTVKFYCVVILLLFLQSTVDAYDEPSSVGTAARVVKKDERRPVFATEFGSISAVDIDDGVARNKFHLQFITMESNSLFLPVLLHSDMIFYVHTGSGRLSWSEGDEDINNVNLERGDVYRLKSGTLFYLHSNLDPERRRFRITAIFASPEEDESQGSSFGPYSSINDLVRGFDKPILQAAFQVPEEVIDEIKSTTDTPAIVQSDQKSKRRFWEDEMLFINALFGIKRLSKQAVDNKKKHTKTFNFFKEDPDFKSSFGWSKAVTKHDLHALKGSQIGIFMVNLTKGSIMGPHWNPAATEVSVVLEGEGMVQVICPSVLRNKECRNARIRVEEGDVFTVPRFHPMAQTSFNNGSFVFMGFSTSSKKNHPQFLAGKASVLQALDKVVLGEAFNVSERMVDQLLAAQSESIILGCTSCAEEQEMVMEEEIERERRKREEEEARRREEEERRRREEEEKRKREEEEARRREEEEEEQKKREEEEAQRKEEEERKRQEEEEEKRRREEEEREEEDKRKQEEEEKQRQKEQEEEEQRRREKEEEQKRREEEEQRRREEEEERRRREKEEEQKRQEEEEQRRGEEEEERRRREKEEEQKRREEEEQRQREEEEEQRRREKEEEQKRQEEEEQRRGEEEEEQRRREKEEEQKRQQEQEEEQMRRETEEEQKRQQEQEEEQRRREKEEEQKRQQEQEEEQRRQEEEQRRREQEEEMEEERQRHEDEQRREQDETQRRQEEKERSQKEERGRGEQESEQEMARREEEERVKRQREEEEAGGRWINLKSQNLGTPNSKDKSK